MSSSAGPSSVTNGLVLHYDMNNIQKSWQGAPVINSQWNSGNENAPFPVGAGGSTTTDVTGTHEAGPVITAKTWKIVKAGSGNIWNGWEATFGSIWSGSAGDVWTTSYWYKTSAPAGHGVFGIGQFYLSDWSRAYNTTVLSNVSDIIADGKWHYNYTVVQFNEAYSNAIIADGPSWGYSTAAGTLYFNGLQWNKNAYAAPFAAGTRSNTQAVIDLTGNNIITANSLTYANDGTASFNGSSNYMEITGPAFTSMSAYTISFWARRDIEGRMPVATKATTAFYWYGDNSWRYTHSSGAGEYYYAKPTSIPLGTWGHYCVTYDGANVTIYRQGVYQGQQATTGTADWSQGMKVGYYAGGSAYAWSGKIDSVSMYNRALTASEVAQNFNAARNRYGL